MRTPRALGLVAVAAAITLAACTPAPPAPGAQGAPFPTPSTTPTTDVTIPWRTERDGSTGGFDITLRFSATLPAAQVDPVIDAFNAAAARWERVITADLPPVTFGGFDGCLGSGSGSTIDDVTIDVTIVPGDGPGGVLGSAGFCKWQGDLPRAGAMRFDKYDIASMLDRGNFDRVVLHEMGHVLGIGTMWSYAGKLDVSNPSDPRFTGTNAVAEWNALTGGTDVGVPVEATGGTGTALAHWRESTFRSELMTGWISNGTSPLSRVSVASLADLGHQVDLTQADPYVLGPSILDLVPGTSSDVHADDDHGSFLLFGPDGPIGYD